MLEFKINIQAFGCCYICVFLLYSNNNIINLIIIIIIYVVCTLGYSFHIVKN